MDGLERRLQEENSTTPTNENPSSISKQNEKESSFGNLESPDKATTSIRSSTAAMEQPNQTPLSFSDRRNSILLTPTYNGFGDNPFREFRHQQTHRTSRQENKLLSDAILDTYFSRLHGKPFYVLEESSTRQKHHMGQLPAHLMMAIYAITVRCADTFFTKLLYESTVLILVIPDILNPQKDKKVQHAQASIMR